MKNDGLHIALDFDDVICDFVSGVCETISRDFAVDVRPEQITDWDFGQFIDEYIGRGWWSWMKDHARLWGDKFRPVPGALGGIEQLRSEGHYLEIVTSKPRWAEGPFWKWMGRYEPAVHKVTIVSAENIGKKSEATDADLLVDDRWENVVEFANDGGIALLYTRPHNDIFDASSEGIIRVSDWHEVKRAVALAGEDLL